MRDDITIRTSPKRQQGPPLLALRADDSWDACMSVIRKGCTVLVAGFIACSLQGSQEDKEFVAPPSKPLSARDEQMTLKLPKGFTVDLVASEPDVIDPVHLAFDENGQIGRAHV